MLEEARGARSSPSASCHNPHPKGSSANLPNCPLGPEAVLLEDLPGDPNDVLVEGRPAAVLLDELPDDPNDVLVEGRPAAVLLEELPDDPNDVLLEDLPDNPHDELLEALEEEEEEEVEVLAGHLEVEVQAEDQEVLGRPEKAAANNPKAPTLLRKRKA